MKKLVALLLALVMVLPLALASCSGDNNDLPPTGDGTTASNGNDTNKPANTEEGNKGDNNGDDGPYEYLPDPDGKLPGKVGIGSNGASVSIQTITVTNRRDKTALLSYDFSEGNPTESWSFAGAEAADFAVTTDAETEAVTLNFSKSGAMAYYGESVWNDIQYALRGVTINEMGNGVVLYVCVTDDKNYVEVIVGDEGGKYITANTVKNGEKTEEYKIPLEIAEVEVGAKFNMSVTVQKESIEVYVNGSHCFNIYEEMDPVYGGIALSSWLTGVSYDNIKVTSNKDGSVLYEEDFSDPSVLESKYTPKKYGGGNCADAQIEAWLDYWVIEADEDADHGNVLTLNTKDYSGFAVALTESIGNPAWTDYTIELDARIDLPTEGWLVFVATSDDQNSFMWNVGGWGNTVTCFEIITAGSKGTQTKVDTKFDTGTWYHLKVVVTDMLVQAYVDGELINTYNTLG